MYFVFEYSGCVKWGGLRHSLGGTQLTNFKIGLVVGVVCFSEVPVPSTRLHGAVTSKTKMGVITRVKTSDSTPTFSELL